MTSGTLTLFIRVYTKWNLTAKFAVNFQIVALRGLSVRRLKIQPGVLWIFWCIQTIVFYHDDVMKWRHFPRNWPFVRGIHRSGWIPRTKASDAELWCFLWSVPEYKCSKQSWGWWFEMPSWSLWRHSYSSWTTLAVNSHNYHKRNVIIKTRKVGN